MRREVRKKGGEKPGDGVDVEGDRRGLVAVEGAVLSRESEKEARVIERMVWLEMGD